MIQRLRKYLVIRSYVQRLGHELVRRFGRKPHYQVKQVTQAMQRGGFPPAFVEYAHAAFCDQADFEAFYKPLPRPNYYRDLRHTIAPRYFSGNPMFDAETIARKFRSPDMGAGDHYESGIGEDLS